jgi:hypothetical protein
MWDERTRWPSVPLGPKCSWFVAQTKAQTEVQIGEDRKGREKQKKCGKSVPGRRHDWLIGHFVAFDFTGSDKRYRACLVHEK